LKFKCIFCISIDKHNKVKLSTFQIDEKFKDWEEKNQTVHCQGPDGDTRHFKSNSFEATEFQSIKVNQNWPAALDQ